MVKDDFEQYWKRFVKKIVQFLVKDGARRPATFIHEMLKGVDKVVKGQNAESIIVWLEKLREVKLPIRADGIVQVTEPDLLEFDALVEKVEAIQPLVFLELAQPVLLVESRMVHLSKVMRGKRRIKRTKGETRADAVRELCETVAEHLYKPYVTMIRHMRQVVAGKPMTPTPINFGTMVNQLVKDEPQSLLIDKDVHWLRNGSSHGHHKYLPDSDSIQMWDTNHPHQVFKVEELSARVDKWVRISSHMMQYRYTWSLSKNWSELFKMGHQVLKSKKAGYP